MKRITLMGICLWIQLLSCVMAEESEAPLPVVVGALSDPAHLHFEGITTFTADEIRNALMRTPDFLLASHPAAQFGDYLPAVKRLVQTGYQHCGFPEAQVSVEIDQTRETIAVTVSEGPRYLCGEIEVIGASTLPTEPFVTRMTEPRAKKAEAGKSESSDTEDPIWETGKPARFSEPSQRRLVNDIRSVLFGLGYYFAIFTAEVVPEPGTSLARLKVEIQDEGSSTINEIIVSGNTKNDREAILRYLGLQEGMLLDYDLLLKTDRLFWRAARFLDYSVTPQVDAEHTAIKLLISVREYESAPTLSESFSPEERVLLKLCDWLSEFPNREDDFMVSVPANDIDIQVQAVISPTKGVLAVVRRHEDTQDVPPLQAVLLTPKKTAIFSPTGQAKFVLPELSAGIIAQFAITPNPDPNEDKLFVLTPRVAVENNPSGDPYSLDLKLAPVFFVYCAHKDNIDLTHLLDKGIVEIAGDSDYHVEIDPQSGRLIKVTQSKGGTEQMAATLDRGLFDALIENIEQITSNHTNRFVPERALGSTVRYLSEMPLMHLGLFERYGDQWDCSEEALGKAVALLGRVLEEAAVPFDQWLIERGPVDDDRFVVPSSTIQTAVSPIGMMVSSIAAQVFGGCNELFPAGSWPWTLARETVFVVSGMGKYTQMELQRIYESPQTGPIGYLVTAKLLTYINKRLSRLFAARGLSKLSFSDFQKDWNLLIVKDHLLSQCFDNTAGALRALDDREIDTLSGLFSQAHTSFVRDYLKRLRAGDTIPTHNALAASLELYWQNVLKQKVGQALRRLVFPAEAASHDTQDANASSGTSTTSRHGQN